MVLNTEIPPLNTRSVPHPEAPHCETSIGRVGASAAWVPDASCRMLTYQSSCSTEADIQMCLFGIRLIDVCIYENLSGSGC